MYDADYYRGQAQLARRHARSIREPEAHRRLDRLARDYDEIAEDIEMGATKIRHPELVPLG